MTASGLGTVLSYIRIGKETGGQTGGFTGVLTGGDYLGTALIL